MLTAVVALGHSPAGSAWLGIPGIVAMHAAFLIGLAVLLPRIRIFAELAATMSLVVALLQIPARMLVPHGPDLTLMATVMGIVGTLALFLAPALDRIMPRRDRTLHSRATSRLPPDRLFARLARTPDHIAPDADAPLVAADWIDPGHRLRLLHGRPDLAMVEEHRTLTAATPGHSLDLRYELPKARDTAQGRAGTLNYRLLPGRAGTRLDLTARREGVTLRRQILDWIDDAPGRTEDALLARLEQAAT